MTLNFNFNFKSAFALLAGMLFLVCAINGQTETIQESRGILDIIIDSLAPFFVDQNGNFKLTEYVTVGLIWAIGYFSSRIVWLKTIKDTEVRIITTAIVVGLMYLFFRFRAEGFELEAFMDMAWNYIVARLGWQFFFERAGVKTPKVKELRA